MYKTSINILKAKSNFYQAFFSFLSSRIVGEGNKFFNNELFTKEFRFCNVFLKFFNYFLWICVSKADKKNTK